MSPELDWTVEYETLPPDERPLFEPPPPPRGRPSVWLWAAAALIIVAGTVFYVLYFLGGRVDPRPEPEPDTDPVQAALESVVALEIRALNSGDGEIYDAVQDTERRRRNEQPQPDHWFAALDLTDGPAGAVELVGIQTIDEVSAVAEIRLLWEGTPYRLYWYYRLHEGHWVHTDWQPMNLVDLEVLTTKHVHSAAHGLERREAGVLMRRTESFLNALCGRVNCAGGPPSVSLELDIALTSYAAEKLTASRLERLVEGPTTVLSYGIPSPLRVRWPADGSPEPLVLASLGRHLAYDLVVGATGRELDPADRAALTLSVVWMAHRLLELPTVSTTRWLDEAAALDGEAAAVAFILALRDGAPWQEALSASFRPETVASISGSNDYVGWLARVADPLNQTAPIYRRTGPWDEETYQLPQRLPSILESLDQEAVPWVPADQAYRKAVPDVSHVVRGDDWVIATAELGGNWVAVHLLKQIDGEWTSQNLDQAIMGDFLTSQGGPYSVTDGPITITYWAWDQPFLAELRRVIRTAHEETVSTFNLASPPVAYTLVPFADPAGTPFEPQPGAVTVLSPAWLTTPTYREIDYRSRILTEVIGYLLQDRLPPFDEVNAWGLYYGIMTTFRARVSQQAGLPDPAGDSVPGERWQPPPTVGDPSWIPLSDLWLSWFAFSGTSQLDLLTCSRLVVDYILGQQGHAALPLMLDAVSSADSMEEWVAAVTGESLETFEPAWRAWVLEQELP
jgi:hypothetical protein